MTALIDKTHWLERSAVQQGHWDQSPWPAKMAQYDSDTEQEEEDEYEQRWAPRQRPARRQETAPLPQSSKIASFKSFEKPTSIRSSSHRHYAKKSECLGETFAKEAIRRRHSRSESTPQPASQALHIDTILPLQLPPPNLWSIDSRESLQRSDSSVSFLSASSDGSWHEDHGDDDPNGQLEKAISQRSSPSSIKLSKMKANDGLIISTYDYEDEDDCFHQESSQVNNHANTADDTEAEAIRLHAGPLMNSVANYLLDVVSSYYTNEASSSSLNQSSMHRRVLTRSHSDRALFGSVSSPHQLTMESNFLHHHRRHRADTAPARTTSLQQGASSSSSLQSLWQWFLPNIDEQLESELFGYPRLSSRPRLDSIPSLYSDTSETEKEDSEDEDDSPFTPGPRHDRIQVDLQQGPLYDYSLKGKQNPLSRSYYKLSSLDASGAPSPLWDNRWVEEPYQRSWSSVMNLASL